MYINIIKLKYIVYIFCEGFVVRGSTFINVDKIRVLLGLNGISSSYSKLIYTGAYTNNCFLAFLEFLLKWKHYIDKCYFLNL